MLIACPEALERQPYMGARTQHSKKAKQRGFTFFLLHMYTSELGSFLRGPKQLW
jgi:hypothetical protein